jgi:hypothetical protein
LAVLRPSRSMSGGPVALAVRSTLQDALVVSPEASLHVAMAAVLLRPESRGPNTTRLSTRVPSVDLVRIPWINVHSERSEHWQAERPA